MTQGTQGPQDRQHAHAGDEELAAYGMDRTLVEPEVARHIADCPQCRREAERYARLAGAMEGELYRADCYAPNELTAYVFGELPAKQWRAVEAHLAECRHCREDVAVTRAVFPAAPRLTIWEVVRRVAAAFVAPGPALNPAFVQRGGPGEHEPLQTFASREEGIEVRLERFEGAPGEHYITGRVTVTGEGAEAPISARLLRMPAEGEAAGVQVAVEALIEEEDGVEGAGEAEGKFDLGPVPPGAYRLEVLLPDRLIEIASLTL
jgi:hypothetical protein